MEDSKQRNPNVYLSSIGVAHPTRHDPKRAILRLMIDIDGLIEQLTEAKAVAKNGKGYVYVMETKDSMNSKMIKKMFCVPNWKAINRINAWSDNK